MDLAKAEGWNKVCKREIWVLEVTYFGWRDIQGEGTYDKHVMNVWIQILLKEDSLKIRTDWYSLLEASCSIQLHQDCIIPDKYLKCFS